MTEERKPAEVTSEASAPPEDFNQYVAWRKGDSSGAAEDPQPESAEEADTSETSQEDHQGTEADAGDDEPEESTEEDEQDEEEAEPPKRKKGGYQRRIDKLTRDKRDLEERVRKLEEGRTAETPAGEKPAGTEAATPEDKPKVEDFEDYEKYVEALTDWKFAQREAADQAKADKRAAETEAKTIAQAYAARESEAKKRIADYDEVVGGAGGITIPPHVLDALLEAERGPEIVYELAKQPDRAKRLAKMTPTAALVELGKIEASLPSKDKPPPTKKVSTAPRPVTPISGGRSSATTTVYDPKLAENFSEWERTRRAQLKRKT